MLTFQALYMHTHQQYYFYKNNVIFHNNHLVKKQNNKCANKIIHVIIFIAFFVFVSILERARAMARIYIYTSVMKDVHAEVVWYWRVKYLLVSS